MTTRAARRSKRKKKCQKSRFDKMLTDDLNCACCFSVTPSREEIEDIPKERKGGSKCNLQERSWVI